jgi:hypothetical protein
MTYLNATNFQRSVEEMELIGLPLIEQLERSIDQPVEFLLKDNLAG